MELKEKLDNLFNASYPKMIQEAMVKCVFHAYAISYETCQKKYPREEAHDLLGFLRWIELRTQLRGIGGRFNEIETFSEPNGSASSYHIVINSDKMILTVSSVPAPSVLPRPAAYRLEYAVQSQAELFEQEFKEIEQQSKVFGIIIHGSDPKDRSKPAFLQVRFPERNYGKYIPLKIDLLARHNSLVKEILGSPSEIDEPLPLTPKVIVKASNET